MVGASAITQAAHREGDWRHWLRRKIGWLLLVKLAALVLLKTLFFSGEHRLDVTPERVTHHLAAPSANDPARSRFND